ncbi:MAG TPA: hypothetical protein VMV33_16710 [Rhodocyclaceae bacterium]|nr:hypothetical protein [Rhodocyclaceae bacterium]
MQHRFALPSGGLDAAANRLARRIGLAGPGGQIVVGLLPRPCGASASGPRSGPPNVSISSILHDGRFFQLQQ